MEIKAKVIGGEGLLFDAVYIDIESENDFVGKTIKGARAYCFYNNQLVIVHETKGHWNLPGGAIEPNEDLRTGIRREIYEETSMKVIKMRLIGLQEVLKPEGSAYYIRAVCLVEPDGEFKTDLGGEVTEIQLIDPAKCNEHVDTRWGEIGKRMLERALEVKEQMDKELNYIK